MKKYIDIEQIPHSTKNCMLCPCLATEANANDYADIVGLHCTLFDLDLEEISLTLLNPDAKRPLICLNSKPKVIVLSEEDLSKSHNFKHKFFSRTEGE